MYHRAYIPVGETDNKNQSVKYLGSTMRNNKSRLGTKNAGHAIFVRGSRRGGGNA